jgi:hypothetical protein
MDRGGEGNDIGDTRTSQSDARRTAWMLIA